jgi:hypothetical protein
MGTVVSVDVRDPGEWSAAMDLVVAWFHRVDAVFSTFRPDSQVSRLGRGEIGEAECDADVREVLALCAEEAATSRGCFDIRAGGRLDPDADRRHRARHRSADGVHRSPGDAPQPRSSAAARRARDDGRRKRQPPRTRAARGDGALRE